MTTNEAILTIKANVEADGRTIEEFVTEWCNASEVEVSEDGNIWIANPQRGHWLSEDLKAEFVAWCEAL
ncbi:hypothetical protein H2509_20645 [Stappia sp. F7233]|uniref:Uncharacterized protein n=1 Tax=Stappia albiluteola TaxID=2758565 RepID=A0A839AL64_9HYPH|nr:hypothetical protein [Stappia albiluteola]MBA5779547.1 hypothetical protein [Stappia albiluteola]